MATMRPIPNTGGESIECPLPFIGQQRLKDAHHAIAGA
jgi:hypothetical protein